MLSLLVLSVFCIIVNVCDGFFEGYFLDRNLFLCVAFDYFLWVGLESPSFTADLYTVVLLAFGVVLVVAFFAPLSTYSYTTVCPTCNGQKIITCPTCHGSGICWVCGGTGRISYMPPGDDWCAACQGTGKCYTCGGAGNYTCPQCGGVGYLTLSHYTLVGSTTGISILNILVVVVAVFLALGVAEFYLSFNDWVYDVEQMDMWFNPSFGMWCYAKDRKRWLKYQVVGGALVAPLVGTMFFSILAVHQFAWDVLLLGGFLSIFVTSVFAFVFYKAYAARLEQPTEPEPNENVTT